MHQPEESQRVRHVSWGSIMELIRNLSDDIPEGSKIWGIPRNGTIIACFMSHHRPDLTVVMELEDDAVVIDDIHDTGKTLIPYEDHYTATLYWRRKDQSSCPNIWAETIEDEWILFPWEILNKEVANVDA